MTYLTFDELVSFKKFVVALHFTVTINSKTCLYLNGIYNNSYDTLHRLSKTAIKFIRI